jgi:hypothetical protein
VVGSNERKVRLSFFSHLLVPKLGRQADQDAPDAQQEGIIHRYIPFIYISSYSNAKRTL